MRDRRINLLTNALLRRFDEFGAHRQPIDADAQSLQRVEMAVELGRGQVALADHVFGESSAFVAYLAAERRQRGDADLEQVRERFRSLVPNDLLNGWNPVGPEAANDGAEFAEGRLVTTDVEFRAGAVDDHPRGFTGRVDGDLHEPARQRPQTRARERIEARRAVGERFGPTDQRCRKR